MFVLPLCCVLLASAPGESRFSMEHAMALKSIGAVAVSPDGKWVVSVVRGNDLVKNKPFSNLELVSADGSIHRSLTSGEHTNGEPSWDPTSSEVAFTSDQGGINTVSIVSVTGGIPRALKTGKQAASRPRWSPDGKEITYLAAEPLTEKESEADRVHADDQRTVDEVRHPVRLWAIAPKGDAKPRPLTSGSRQVDDYAWAPDAVRIAIMTSPGTAEFEGISQTHITVINRDGSSARDLAIGRAWSFTAVTWSPDGRYVAYSCDYPELKLAEPRINLLDVKTGDRTALPPDFDGGESGYAWAGANTIVFSAATGVSARLFRYDVGSRRVTPLPVPEGQVYSALSSDKTGTVLAYEARDASRPAEVYITSLATVAPRMLSDLNPALAKLTFGPTQVATWKSADGWPMDGVLVLPPGYRPGTRYPMIVYIHGGPSGVNQKVFDPFWQLLAANGYVVFAPNPRGSTGHGDKFYAGNYKDFGGKDYEDIMTGIDHLVQTGVADPDRLGVWGWSYGGYMTYWLVTHTTRFKAAMSGAGMSDLFSFYAQSDIQSVWDPSYFGVSPYRDRALYERMSAMTYIDRAVTPTLIMYGASDVRVPYAQGREFYVALRKRGIPTKLVLYPREAHGFREPDHLRDRWQRSIDWFDRYILKKGASTS